MERPSLNMDAEHFRELRPNGKLGRGPKLPDLWQRHGGWLSRGVDGLEVDSAGNEMIVRY